MSIVRIFALLSYLTIFGASVLGASDLRRKSGTKIECVAIKYMGESNFKTIGEYFGSRREHQYFRCVARDAENGRAGTYFIVGLSESVEKLPPKTSARIHLIMSIKEGVRIFECKIPGGKKFPLVSEIYCGIVSEKIDISQIKAWNVEFIDGKGNVLFSRCSYMWAL
ncbi:MAG: hypothetical protein LBI81_00580 [Puniceicoccales bacterium]|jgi:hypothetical protein|nr:hypothetical protein [Puniceicoccales bacterium]